MESKTIEELENMTPEQKEKFMEEFFGDFFKVKGDA
jgi:hypothetical protein